MIRPLPLERRRPDRAADPARRRPAPAGGRGRPGDAARVAADRARARRLPHARRDDREGRRDERSSPSRTPTRPVHRGADARPPRAHAPRRRRRAGRGAGDRAGASHLGGRLRRPARRRSVASCPINGVGTRDRRRHAARLRVPRRAGRLAAAAGDGRRDRAVTGRRVALRPARARGHARRRPRRRRRRVLQHRSPPRVSRTAAGTVVHAMSVESFPAAQIGEERTIVFTALNAAAGLILLLSLVNVTTLLTARANARVRETAVRMALGASTGRLVVQGMWETRDPLPRRRRRRDGRGGVGPGRHHRLDAGQPGRQPRLLVGVADGPRHASPAPAPSSRSRSACSAPSSRCGRSAPTCAT